MLSLNAAVSTSYRESNTDVFTGKTSSKLPIIIYIMCTIAPNQKNEAKYLDNFHREALSATDCRHRRIPQWIPSVRLSVRTLCFSSWFESPRRLSLWTDPCPHTDSSTAHTHQSRHGECSTATWSIPNEMYLQQSTMIHSSARQNPLWHHPAKPKTSFPKGFWGMLLS